MNECKRLVCEEPTEIGRRMLERLLGELLDDEMAAHCRAGVRVIEAEGGNDLTGGNDDPTRKLIRQVLGAVAEFEKSETAIKQRAARDRKSSEQRRRCEGRKRFGSTPSERAAVERMLELRRKPKSRGWLGASAIAEILDAEGHKTCSGKPWHPYVVLEILKRGR
jgi:DNA invertase Pin-like site-specific DNA recombinase